MRVTIGGLLGILALVIALFALGFPTAAWFVGNIGTLVFMIGIFVWIGFADPRKKWPAASIGRRFVNLITYKR